MADGVAQPSRLRCLETFYSLRCQKNKLLKKKKVLDIMYINGNAWELDDV